MRLFDLRLRYVCAVRAPTLLAFLGPILAHCAQNPGVHALKPPLFAPAAIAPGDELDAFHRAASAAEEDRYFAHFAEEGVFLGTDATERWTVSAFRTYAHPHFARGKAWSFRAGRRAIAFNAEASVAWFDEDLITANLGPARGSGVLVLRKGRWLIAQYNLSIPIPNARFGEVKQLLEGKLEPQHAAP
jgi:SnoaL-like domain